MTMSMQEAIYKRNLESSILFMQQEHAATLKALHEEISNLQKKCSDLTFQLNMAGLDLGKTVDPETKEHINHLEKMIDTQREGQHELEVELNKKDRLIQEIEYTYKRQKMKQIEEMRNKNQEIELMKAELESTANQNAYYVNELHKIKKQEIENSGRLKEQVMQKPMHMMPTPPKLKSNSSHRSSHIRRSLATANVDELQAVHIPASAGAVRKGSSGSNRSDSPAQLIKPFLRESDTDPGLHIKQSNPLPPIRTSATSRVMFKDQVEVPVVVTVAQPVTHQVKRSSVKSQSQEVETLAVGQLSHSARPWNKRTQESRSSEYR